MKKLLLLLGGLASVAALPLLAVLAVLGVATSALACTTGPAIGLRPDAPVPARALPWIAATRAACPDLPAPWIAAVMAQESSFQPDAFSDDVNGGTWGLFQINNYEWATYYGHPWSADLDHNGVWDIKDPLTHARVGGTYLCHRLAGVRTIRTQHPGWASTHDLTELEALAVAHMAGEAALGYYPALGPLTSQYLTLLRQRVAAWSAPVVAPRPAPTASTPMPSPPPLVSGCVASPSGPMARAAVAWALDHVGDAYVAGAHGPHAWDCSTFTYNAYRAAGLDWSMEISYEQYLDRTHVQLIPLAQAQPGDLLFFDTNSGNSWFNPVTHVAMVVDPAAGTMVHAANPSVGVTISNYKTSGYYRDHPPVAAPGADGKPVPGGEPVAGRILAPAGTGLTSAVGAGGSSPTSVAP